MVFVDNMRAKFGRMIMCHMTADSVNELHDMAESIGIRRRWFQYKKRFPHYDICMSKKKQAVNKGAKEVTMREMAIMKLNGIFKEEE